MKHTFHIIDVFVSAPIGGARVEVPPDAAGISTEGTERVSMRRRSETESEARKRDGVVTSVSVDDAIGWEATKPGAGVFTKPFVRNTRGDDPL